MTGAGAYYRLARGIDVVPLGDEKIMFRSDSVVLRLEGQSAVFFAEQVLPLLDGRRTLSEIAEGFPRLPEDDLRQHLDGLVDAKVLIRSANPRETTKDSQGFLSPFSGMLETLGVPLTEALNQLGTLNVAVFGLEAHGAHVADMLVRTGVGTITLVDPYPCQAADLALMPLMGKDVVGKPRQLVVKDALDQLGASAKIIARGDGELNREQVKAVADEANMLVGCFDRGFLASNLWINRASLALRVPAIYGELRGSKAWAGPMVFPEETACYLCWRMRGLACEDDFGDAMGYEEFLDRQRQPSLHRRPSLPPAAQYLASQLSLEILKTVLALGTPTLASKVLEFDALTMEQRFHTVLQKPDCPACKKKHWRAENPPLDELSRPDEAAGNVLVGDVLAVAGDLISDSSGIIRNFRRVSKDPSEPAAPYIFRAELANHRFLSDHGDEFVTCSGKGVTFEQAKVSALGEAVERYSSSVCEEEDILVATRDAAPGPTLDPRRLVLFAPEQYAGLKYDAYDDSSELGWVSARSLVTGKELFVPAMAVYLAYDLRAPKEYLFPITSNGLAAGRTLADAVLAAALEVIERDAFINMWFHRLSCQRIDPAGHPDADVVDLCRAYGRRGVHMELYRIPTDHPAHVFAAIGVQDERAEGPAVVMGLGADLDPARAARGAVLEVAQVRPALRIRLRDPKTHARMEELLEDPKRVTELEDHDLLYASKKMLGHFDFLREASEMDLNWNTLAPEDTPAKLDTLVEHMRADGGDIIYFNLTSSDLAPFGLHTVRAIIPDFQPINFGRGERRLGGDRLFDVPRRLGLRPDRATIDDLNDDPHPLA